MKLAYLVGKKVFAIYYLYLEIEGRKYKMDDSVIFNLGGKSMVQLLFEDSEFNFIKINSIENAKIIGDFEEKRKYILKALDISSNEMITHIESYKVNMGDYHFASQLFDSKNQFILGFSFGFDEIEIIGNQKSFNKMLTLYRDYEIF